MILSPSDKLLHQNNIKKDSFNDLFSLQASLCSSQTNWVNIKDGRSAKLFHHGNKHDSCAMFYDIEQVHMTAKPEANWDWWVLYGDKNIGNVIGIGGSP